MCDIVFVISLHWDVLNAVARTFIPDTVSRIGLIWEGAAVHIYIYNLTAN